MVTLIPGPRSTQLESRVDFIATQVDAAIDSVVLRARDWYQSINDVNIVRALWLEHVDTALIPLISEAYHVAATDTWEKLSAIDVDVERTLTAALIPKLVMQVADGFLDNVKRRLVGLGDLLWNAMRTELTRGLQIGESIDGLRERLTAGAGSVAARVRNAARTEVIGASNAGSFAQMKAAQVVALKTWVARDDDRTRQSHRDVDGVQIDMNTKFIVGGHALDYPHDPTAPPEETINCRCTLAWKIVPVGDVTDELVIESLTADAFHLPGQHDQSEHGRKSSHSGSHVGISPKINEMLATYEAGYDVIDELEAGGSGATVQRLRLANGTEVIRKTNPRPQTITKNDPVRAEYLGGLVLNAVGVNDMHTALVDENTTITTFADGPSASRSLQHLDNLNFADYQTEFDKAMRRQVTARNGKAIGVADHLMMNVDRNTNNWIVGDDGVKPIDQGNALFVTPPGLELVTSGSPFTEYWLGEEVDPRTGEITSLTPRVTRAEVESYRDQLNAIRTEFSEPGEDEYFDALMRRLADIEMRLPR